MGRSRSCPLIVFGALVAIFGITHADAAFVGVVYGYTETGPTPDEALQLLRANGIYQVRIYDSNPLVLTAFSNTSMEVVVGVTNQELPLVGQSNVTAANWVKSNILPFTPYLNITSIAVGSEVLTSAGGNLSSMLIPAMRYIYDALVSVGLDDIKVTTPHNIAVLENNFPPSQGSFNKSFLPVIVPLLNFLSVTESYFMLNLYPYFAYQENSQAISLAYALFEPNEGVEDTFNNDRYYSLYDALLDAVYAAMKTLNSSELSIVVSETGWPSAGDPDELGNASIANAQAYNGNLATRVYNKTGSPLKPYDVSSAYIYELFNEESRTGPLSERSWGLFNSNTTPVYAVDLTGTGRSVVGNSTNSTWCVAKQGVTEQSLQRALDFACGQGAANCTAIQNGGVCWLPNTVQSHASFAMNSYFQKEGDVGSTCDFYGLGVLTYIDPSYDSCVYILNTTALAQSGGGSIDDHSGAGIPQFHAGLISNTILSLLLAVSASLL